MDRLLIGIVIGVVVMLLLVIGVIWLAGWAGDRRRKH
jgi:cbb3-type cytochrome oxidase subunit 3